MKVIVKGALLGFGLMTIILLHRAHAEIFYSQDTDAFGETTNWNTQSGGGGDDAEVSNFTSPDTFIIQDTHTITMDNTTTLIGRLVIEDGGEFDNSSYEIVFGKAGDAFDIQSGGTYTPSTGKLVHNAGGFSTITFTTTTATDLYDVEANGPITFSGGTFTIDGTFFVNTSQTISGTIAYNATTGKLRYGTSRTATTTEWPSGGVANVLLGSGAVTISSGTFTVNSKLTKINGSITVTGGSLTYASLATLEYAPSPAAAQNIGGEWPTSDGPSNVTVNNNGQSITQTGTTTDRTVPRTLTATAGTLAMGANDLTLSGALVGGDLANGGSITSSGTITMGNGSTEQYDQTISGSVTLSNLTINKSEAGGDNTVTVTGNPDITGTLTLTAGDLEVSSGSITTATFVQSAGTVDVQSSSSFTVDTNDLTVNGGTFTNSNGTITVSGATSKISVASGAEFEMTTGATALTVYEIELASGATYKTGGKTIQSLTVLDLDAASTFEFNGSSIETTPLSGGATFGNLNMNNSSGLTIDGDNTIDGTLTFSQDATVSVTTGNSLTMGPGPGGAIVGANSSRYVTGPLRKEFASGVQSFTYPVGYSTTYLPATHYYLSNSVATSIVEVEAVQGNPGGSAPTGIGSISTDHYFTVIERGTGGTFTFNFEGTYTGSGFSPESRNQLIVQSGAGPSYSYPNTITQTITEASDLVRFNDALSSLPSGGIIAIGSGSGTVVWDGSEGTLWSDDDNWVGGLVPQNGDAVEFTGDYSGGGGTAVYDASTSQNDFASITLNPSDGSISLTLTRSTTLNLTSDPAITVSDANATLIYNGTTVQMDGSAYDNTSTTFSAGLVQYNSGSIHGDDYDGNLTLNNSGSVSSTGIIDVTGTLTKQNTGTFTADATVTAGTFEHDAGTVNMGSNTLIATTLDLSNGEISSSGQITITTFNGSGGTLSTSGSGNLVITSFGSDNAATINIGGSGASSITNTFTNASGGSISISGNGTMAINGGITNGGSLTVSSGSNAVTFASLTNNGTLTVNGNKPVTVSGNYSGTGSIAASSGTGAIAFNGLFSPTGSGTLAFGSQALTLGDGSGDDVTLGGTTTLTASSNTSFGGTDFEVNGGTITQTGSGVVIFAGAGAQTVTVTSGSATFPGITVNNSNGLTLNDDASVNGTFTLTSGNVNTAAPGAVLQLTDNASVSGGSSSSFVNGPMQYAGTTGDKDFPIGAGSDYRPVVISSLSGSSPVIQFEMINSNPGGTPGDVPVISTVRYWQGTISSGTVSAGFIDLTYGVDDQVQDAADVVVVRSSTINGTYNSLGGSGVGAPTGHVTSTSSFGTSLDYFTLGSTTTDNSLPVELASFEANGNFSDVTLNWATSSEIENLGFNILRSTTEESNWIQVNDAMISGQGNSSEETSYQFVDAKVVAGETYSYRLESVSLNGVVEVEKTVEVLVPVPAEFALLNNYPNPFNPTTNLKFQLPEISEVSVDIYDITGKLVKKLVHNQTYQAGEFVVQWDATDEFQSRVSSGMYLYHFRAGKFSKVSKMVLLK